MDKMLHCGLKVNEFELQLCYYIHFRNNSFGKGMSLFIPPAIAWVISLQFFKKDGFGIKFLTKVDMPLKKKANLELT